MDSEIAFDATLNELPVGTQMYRGLDQSSGLKILYPKVTFGTLSVFSFACIIGS